MLEQLAAFLGEGCSKLEPVSQTNAVLLCVYAVWACIIMCTCVCARALFIRFGATQCFLLLSMSRSRPFLRRSLEYIHWMRPVHATSYYPGQKKEPCCWCMKSESCDIEESWSLIQLQNRERTRLTTAATSRIHASQRNQAADSSISHDASPRWFLFLAMVVVSKFNGSHFGLSLSSTEWLDWAAISCELWRIRTSFICSATCFLAEQFLRFFFLLVWQTDMRICELRSVLNTAMPFGTPMYFQLSTASALVQGRPPPPSGKDKVRFSAW